MKNVLTNLEKYHFDHARVAASFMNRFLTVVSGQSSLCVFFF